jgi:hypothetical protein
VKLHYGDCLKLMDAMEPDSVQLVFGSPPYEDARTYGIKFRLKGQAWVDWMVKVYTAAQRICTGLVAFVVDGKTKDFRWSAVPVLLAADLHRAGFNLRDPAIFHRVGIAGSGGPDWLRGDTEYIICTTRPGRLPWSDNQACGHPPKWPPGGDMSHRLADGQRVNARGTGTRGHRNGDIQTVKGGYTPPALANPGNCIEATYTAAEVKQLLLEHGNYLHFDVGKGHMGSDVAHENEAPFPQNLAEFFVRSFCPPGGIVLDPFAGSGTTLAAAKEWGRDGIGIDIRQEQLLLIERRLAGITQPLFV